MRKRRRFHLRHDVRAVVLGRSRADTETSGNHLVHVALDKQRQDFALARCQSFKARLSLTALGGLLRNRVATRECLIENLKQSFWIDRLFDKMHGAGAHGIDGHRHTALAGHDDERGLYLSACQLLLQLKSAHSRQADIHHRANRCCVFQRGKKVLRRRECPRAQAACFQEHRQGIADRRIVVDDVDGGIMFHIGPALLRAGRRGNVSRAGALVPTRFARHALR